MEKKYISTKRKCINDGFLGVEVDLLLGALADFDFSGIKVYFTKGKTEACG